MAETVAVRVSEQAAKRLRELAEEHGETLETVASQVLEDTAAELEGDLGDDAELRRRIAEWRRTRESVPASEAHAWLESLDTPSPKPRPKPTRA